LSLADPEIRTEFNYFPIWLCHCFGSFACYHGESLSPLPPSFYLLPSSPSFVTSSFSFIINHNSLFGIEANIQTTDYYLVRNRKLHVPMLYQNEGIYRYKGGVNWRAVVALVIVIPINLPGLINAIDKTVQTGNHKFLCMSFSSSLSLSPV
jgi:cytosine/uracil/thiamine/allantoin permease